MPKEIIIANYQSAYDLLFGQWFAIDPCDCYEEENDEFPLRAHEQSCLSIILKKEAWRELSDEAKEMINVLLYSPAEVLELVSTPNTKKITVRSIRKYFNILWKSKFITNMAIREITNWVNRL